MIEFHPLTLANWSQYVAQIAELEETTYEPGRRDSMDYLKSWIEQEGGLGLVVTSQDNPEKVLGYAFGGPLEHSQGDGPKQDKMRGKHNTFYSTNVLLSASVRGQGLGLLLKQEQMRRARAIKHKDGSPRYGFITGRNRVGYTPEIRRINRALGAYTVDVYEGQYGDPQGQALYYRIPLRRPTSPLTPLPVGEGDKKLDWASSIQAPLGAHSTEIERDIQMGRFTSAVGTKLTLSNWVTPDVVRYAELLRRLGPRACQHTYFTSGRDEVVDKGIRCLRVNRPSADIVIGLSGQYVGHTTAAARSLSEAVGEPERFSWFAWPRVKHDVSEIKAAIEQYSAERILGIVVELVGEKSGHVIDGQFLGELSQLREQTGIPLIFVETASAFGRNGQTLFMSDSLAVQPNMVWWYTGAQLGHVFVDDKHYVAKPLTLISTWDGDEISIRRTYRHLVVARNLLRDKTAAQFEKAVREAISLPITGQGLWLAIQFGERDRLLERAGQQGLILTAGYHNRALLCPPVNLSERDIHDGVAILKRVIDELS